MGHWDITLRRDKIAHLIVGCMLSLLGMAWSPLYFAGFAFGVAKELLDMLGYGTPEWDDLWCTWFGASIAVVFGLIVT